MTNSHYGKCPHCGGTAWQTDWISDGERYRTVTECECGKTSHTGLPFEDVPVSIEEL